MLLLAARHHFVQGQQKEPSRWGHSPWIYLQLLGQVFLAPRAAQKFAHSLSWRKKKVLRSLVRAHTVDVRDEMQPTTTSTARWNGDQHEENICILWLPRDEVRVRSTKKNRPRKKAKVNNNGSGWKKESGRKAVSILTRKHVQKECPIRPARNMFAPSRTLHNGTINHTAMEHWTVRLLDEGSTSSETLLDHYWIQHCWTFRLFRDWKRGQHAENLLHRTTLTYSSCLISLNSRVNTLLIRYGATSEFQSCSESVSYRVS